MQVSFEANDRLAALSQRHVKIMLYLAAFADQDGHIPVDYHALAHTLAMRPSLLEECVKVLVTNGYLADTRTARSGRVVCRVMLPTYREEVGTVQPIPAA